MLASWEVLTKIRGPAGAGPLDVRPASAGLQLVRPKPEPTHELLLLLLRGAGLCRWRRCDQAQRASNYHVVSRQVQLLAALRHLGQELLVGKRHAVAQVNEHVRHRAVARTLPVA